MKQAYHHKDLRNALIEVALAVLAEKGSGEITLRDLARRLGVTHTAPYAHFADKNALLEAIADEGFARLAAVLGTAGGSAATPEERLLAQGLTYVKFARENPNLYRLMFADPELANDPDRVWSEDATRAFGTLVDALAAVGVPEGTNVADVARATWSMVHGVAMLEIDRRFGGKSGIEDKTPTLNGDEIVRLQTKYLLAGLRA